MVTMQFRSKLRGLRVSRGRRIALSATCKITLQISALSRDDPLVSSLQAVSDRQPAAARRGLSLSQSLHAASQLQEASDRRIAELSAEAESARTEAAKANAIAAQARYASACPL